MRGRTNALPLEAKQALARTYGIGHVVALCPRSDPDWTCVSDVVYHHWPMPDGHDVPPWIDERAEWLAEEVKAGVGVLAYCNAGRNRSCLLAARIIQKLEAAEGDAAVRWLRRCRPNSLANPAFVAYLTAAAV